MIQVIGAIAKDPFQCQPLVGRSIVEQLKRLGIGWHVRAGEPGYSPDGSADVALFTSEFADYYLGSSVKTKILFDYNDIETVTRERRQILNDGGVAMMWKANTFSDPELHNAETVEGCYHATEVVGGDHDPLEPLLTADALDRIEWLNLEPWHRYFDRLFVSPSWPSFFWPKLGHRPIDVMFVGSRTSNYTPAIRQHRTEAVDAIESMPYDYSRLIGCRRIFQNWQEYLPALTSSKIVVSPWGHGAACHRDFEAAVAGCVVVKPHLPGHEYPIEFAECRSDFSDLDEVVESVLDDINLWDVIANHTRDSFLVARPISRLASHIQRILNKAIAS